MGNLSNPRLIILKGALFLLLGALASTILIVRYSDWQTAALLAIAVWAFCRFYYFAFYVVERYVDSRYRFTGLTDFIVYLLRRRTRTPESNAQ